MPQLLLELFSEEIPARMQGGAARDLERMAAERLKAAGLTYESLTTFAGPRRLTLVVEGLPAATPDREEEVKGPRANAPEQALDGFLRKTGLTKDQLVERDGVFFAVIRSQGQDTSDIIWDALQPILLNFPWPKSMRWGPAIEWIRPLRRILCIFDGKVVPGGIGGAKSIGGIEFSDVTEGHRFMGSGRPFSVKDFADYRAKLEKEFVLLDVADRKLRILEGAKAVCAARGLALVDDDGLLDEVAGLAEWPTPILGDMDPAFLSLPPEVVRLSMKVHQKYFAVRDPAKHGLAPHFVVVANVEATDGGKALAAGNSRVLSARLDDARFFWDEDLKTGFEVWAKRLEGVTFHAKLGTLAERVERIAALAREIAPLVGADPDQAERAARLAKADLASAMVGEFPELQGVMGGYYARALPLDGEGLGWGGGTSRQDMAHEASSPVRPSPSAPADQQTASTPSQPSPVEGEGYRDAIADAVRDHYKPQGPADSVPTAPLTVAVALADKLDTLVGFFAIDEKPTGSKDPFALRRAALGVIRLALENELRMPLAHVISDSQAASWVKAWGKPIAEKIELELDAEDGVLTADGAVRLDALRARDLQKEEPEGRDLESDARTNADLLDFFADRLKVLLRDQGKRHDLVDAVFALGDDDLVRIVRRVEALEAFLETESGANLLAAHKRAVSILNAEEKKGALPTGPAVEPRHTEIEEGMLFAALQMADQRLVAALAAEEFEEAMLALANLRGPVYAFFDNVFVNEPAHRDNRLRLLGQVRAVMGRVADFGMIAG